MPEAGGGAEKKRKANAAAKDRATAVVMAREMKTKVAAGVFLGEWRGARDKRAVEDEVRRSSSTSLVEIGIEADSEWEPICRLQQLSLSYVMVEEREEEMCW